jgi:hypothetical protein
MSLMEYKFNRVIRNGSTTKAFLTFHIGEITTELEEVLPNTEESVTRYRRTATVSTGTLKKNGTLTDEQMAPFLNAELATRAAVLGHTPIEEQTNE